MNDDPLDPRIAQRLARAAQAAQELSDALWEALREELVDARPEQVAELSRRLVAVAGTVSTLARTAGEPTTEQRPVGMPGAAGVPQRQFPPPPRARATGERPSPVLVDELAGQVDVEAYTARARRRPATVEDPSGY